MNDSKTVRPGHPVTYVEVAPENPLVGGIAADLCPGESDLIEDPLVRAHHRAEEAIRAIPPATAPDHNPDHDSLFVRFNLLERTLDEINARINWADHPGVGRHMEAAEQLVALIRAEVLK